MFSRHKWAEANLNSKYFDSMHKTLTSSNKTKFQHGKMLDGHEVPSLTEELLAFNSC